ncbi:MAG: sensor histidine kinase [Fusobacteriaceae bacterium]
MNKYLKDLFVVFIILVLTVFIGKYLFSMNFGEENIISIFILSVLIIATQIDKYISGIFSSIFSVLTFNFFFTAPKYSFKTNNPKYIVTFTVMLIISLIIITLMDKIKKHIKVIEKNSNQSKILLNLNEEIQNKYTKENIIKSSLDKITNIFNKSVYYEICPLMKENNNIYIDNFNYYIFVENIYIPLRVKKKVLGIIYMNVSKFEEADFYLLISIINQISMTIEKLEVINDIKSIEYQIEEEKFKTNILRSISHDLRTPLTSISGSAYSLLKGKFSEEITEKLIEDIYDESNWLIELIENLLSLSKIQNTAFLEKQLELVEDIVEESINHANKEIINYNLKISIEDNLTVKCDGNLMVQVLINLLNNAIKYSEKNSNIQIIVIKKEASVLFRVEDTGIGIPDCDKKNIFDSFYTKKKTNGDSRRGFGLGLFLCKSIIQCHGGDIIVMDNNSKGTVFEFNIPN